MLPIFGILLFRSIRFSRGLPATAQQLVTAEDFLLHVVCILSWFAKGIVGLWRLRNGLQKSHQLHTVSS